MPAGLDGRQFIATSVMNGDDEFPLVPGTRISISFNDGIQANAGCNQLFASYTLDGDRLIIDGVGGTEMGCEQPLMAQDQWLSTFLDSDPTYALNGNDLTLTSGDFVITLSDREVVDPDQPLTNVTWTLTSLISGDAVSSLPEGVLATLLFHDDGTVDVQTGCNSGGGTYTVEGDRITFGPIALTRMACAGAAGAVETAVAAVLGAGETTYTIDASTLTLMAGADGLQYSAAMDLPLVR
jgi:heat shock protein HslJ